MTARGYRAAKTRAASAQTARLGLRGVKRSQVFTTKSDPAGTHPTELVKRRFRADPTHHTSIRFTETVALEVLTASVGLVGYAYNNERLLSYFGDVPPEEYEAHYYAGKTGPSADDDTNTTAVQKPARWSP